MNNQGAFIGGLRVTICFNLKGFAIIYFIDWRNGQLLGG